LSDFPLEVPYIEPDFSEWSDYYGILDTIAIVPLVPGSWLVVGGALFL
jgi:hypothetical protein